MLNSEFHISVKNAHIKKIHHYSHPPLNDTVKSLNSNFNSEQYAFPIKTT